MRQLALLFVSLSTLVVHVEAQDRPRMVLNAVPEIRVSADRDRAGREDLAPEDREENRIVIVKDGESYRWASRENRELIYSYGGVFHSFTDPGGGGWIRVLDQRGVPESLRFEGADLQFFESVSSGLTTITYWGTASEFDP